MSAFKEIRTLQISRSAQKAAILKGEKPPRTEETGKKHKKHKGAECPIGY
jgi:hypothetical protein